MKSGSAFLLAVLLGVFLAVGQCGSGSAGEDSGSSGGSASADSGDDQDSGDDRDSGDDATTQKDENPSEAERLKSRLDDAGLAVVDWSAVTNQDCAQHSYGAVRRHFATQPCGGVERAWYAVRNDGTTAVLAVSWTEMPDSGSATELQELIDSPGTGNLTELTKDGGPYHSVAYSGWNYRSGRDSDVVRSIQAEPLAGTEASRELARRAAAVADED